MKFFKKYIEKHASLLVIIAGAFSFFLSNILNKEIFSAKEYGYYSIFITYLSVIYLFGILGLEQNLLRFSSKKNNTIETQITQIRVIFLVSILSTLVGSLFFLFFYPEIKIFYALLLIITYSMINKLFLSNLFRVNLNFVYSQLISNFWKIVLFLISIVFFIFKIKSFEKLILLISSSILVIFVFSLILFKKKIQIKYVNDINDKTLYTSALHFFISITLFTILIFADRFIIEKKFSVEEFGNYFYLTNFFLAPFSIIQNYIGFKQLIYFKHNFSFPEFKLINLKNFILGIFLSFVLYFFSTALTKLGLSTFKFESYFYDILIILLIGVLRLFSSSILSAFEALANVESLKKANMYIITITFISLSIANIFCFSIITVLLCFVVIWFFRSLTHLYLLKKQLNI
ncbi:O-antigen polymerase [Flavobacterium cucumis]|uniref:Membrane protein involved in the export of O-antigen and teichoic acid n=1 Tax=Flavobacterium cucumis TaxID=416016 RepID=A0A1M7ZU63_9FLAO|nr:O-antigen polymerase [Flavobacterium cucumis]SHO72439.1 hypothetical protein SAMN05443547_0771 [Flavobacterium cucumis]